METPAPWHTTTLSWQIHHAFDYSRLREANEMLLMADKQPERVSDGDGDHASSDDELADKAVPVKNVF